MALPTTDAAIANIALHNVGSTRIITALTDDGLEAETCARFFELSRDSVLAAAKWPFARKESVLSEVAASWAPERWGYAYTLPSDFIAAHGIWTGARVERHTEHEPFELGPNSDASATVLYTDVAPVTSEAPLLVYTYRHVTWSLWRPRLVDAVAWELATRIAMPLTQKVDIYRNALDMARHSLNVAIADAFGNTAREDATPDSEFVAVRG